MENEKYVPGSYALMISKQLRNEKKLKAWAKRVRDKKRKRK